MSAATECIAHREDMRNARSFMTVSFFTIEKSTTRSVGGVRGGISCELISTKELALVAELNVIQLDSLLCVEKDVLIDDDYCHGQRCEKFSLFDLRQSLICVKWWTRRFFIPRQDFHGTKDGKLVSTLTVIQYCFIFIAPKTHPKHFSHL